MPYQAPFTKGLLLGASAALLWALARQLGRESQPRMLDWDWATRVALQTSGEGASLHPAARARLQDTYRAMLREIEQPIADYTGTTLALSETEIKVMDRHDWIRANVANFRNLFQPFEDLYASTNQSPELPGLALASRAMLSAQVGLLLGFLARRVLGQYDVSILGREPLSPGQLYFVEPNIQAVGGQLGVPSDQFRTWIALHEATHAHEFEVHPWVRGYMNETLQAYLRSVVEDMRAQSRGSGDLLRRITDNLRRRQPLLEAMMTPHQRQLVSRLQALMSLAEGYSNHVMNQLGQRLLSRYGEMKQRMEQRQRQRTAAERLFLRLTGLAMKMEQYALGEAFVGQVVDQRGMAFLNQAWSAPEFLPTESEIREPERWIRRMEVRAA